MKKSHLGVLRWSLGVVYLIFGLLKFFPQTSPAETLVIQTVDKLFFGIFPHWLTLLLVALWEVGVAIWLFSGWKSRGASLTVMVHLCFTFAPLLLLPNECFTETYSFTLVGQYIAKNVVLMAAAYVMWSESS